MGILVGFSPFFVFALLARFESATASLLAAAGVAAALAIRQRLRGKSTKILEAGTVVLFSGLGVCSWITHTSWDVPAVRAVVDLGLLLIILLSLVIRQPFTLQYAREQVPAALHQSPTFVKTNYVISSIWALAMTVVVLADLTMHFVPNVPAWGEVAAIVGAVWFTKWYPDRQRAHSQALT